MHKLRCILLGLAVLPSFAAAQSRPAPAAPVTTAAQVLVQGASCAFFSASAPLPDWLPKAKRRPARFTPTLAQATAAEQALQQVQLLAINPGRKTSQDSAYAQDISAHLSSFLRQYFGFYNQQHQPCLHINLLHSSLFQPDADLPATITSLWLQQAVFVSDGGSGHWSLNYNLATGRFFQYWHNVGLGGS